MDEEYSRFSAEEQETKRRWKPPGADHWKRAIGLAVIGVSVAQILALFGWGFGGKGQEWILYLLMAAACVALGIGVLGAIWLIGLICITAHRLIFGAKD